MRDSRPPLSDGPPWPGAFESFTIRARRALVIAQYAAQQTREATVGPLLLLLGVITQEDAVGSTVLRTLGVELPELRRKVRSSLKTYPNPPQPPVRLSDLAKAAIEEAVRAARQLDVSHVGTEHLLIGTLTHDPVAATILRGLHIDLRAVRLLTTGLRVAHPSEPLELVIRQQQQRLNELAAELQRLQERFESDRPQPEHESPCRGDNAVSDSAS